MSDFALALAFWLLFEAVSLPLRWALSAFSLSRDLRRFISRVAGPPILALAVGFAAHGWIGLGQAQGWVWIGLAGAAALMVNAWSRGAEGVRTALFESLPIRRKTWKRDLLLEAAAMGSFFGYVAFRRLAPEMTFEVQNSGAEKFANAMLFWSCWHAESLPPQDYWFAGLPQTYYYLGHFFWSWIGRLGGFPASVVITLSLGRVVALTVEASYLLLRAFRLSWRAALVGALLIAWGGNPQAWLTAKKQFDTRLELARAGNGEPAAGLLAEVKQATRDWNWQSYPFWEPSRVIEGTVNEFPAWSAILGDFHAHHLALPWLIGWFAVVLQGDRWFLRAPPRSGRFHRLLLAGIVFGGLGSVACLANTWSLPVVLVGSAFVFLWRRQGPSPMALLFPPLALTGLMALAFVLGRHSPLDPLGGGGDSGAAARGLLERLPVKLLPGTLRSGTGALMALWGFQIVALGIAVVGMLARRSLSATAWCWLVLGALLMGLKIFLFNGHTLQRDEPALYWLGLTCWVIALSCGRRPFLPVKSAIGGAAACILLAGLEFVYIQDRMTGELARYNTYFKFSYAAWPLLSAVAFVGVVKFARVPRSGPGRWALRILTSLSIPLMLGMWIFGGPARVLQARIGDDLERRPTLDAFQWLDGRDAYRSESFALSWIREHVPPNEIVAEASSPSGYAFQGRVASLAGRPVPLGWGHHEAQWRGAAIYEPLAARHEAVNALYRAPDSTSMRQAAAGLGVRWALLGKVEREKYGERDFEEALETMREAAIERFAYPADAPETFVFEFTSRKRDPEAPLDGVDRGPGRFPARDELPLHDEVDTESLTSSAPAGN